MMPAIMKRVTPLALALSMSLSLGMLAGCSSDAPTTTGADGSVAADASHASDESVAADGFFSADASAAADKGDREPGLGVLDSFTAQDIEGNEVDESVFATSKLTMVNIWGTYCAPCINEMPGLGELAGEYDPADFQIVGIVSDACDLYGNVDASVVDTAQEIIETTGASYLQLLPTGDLWEPMFSVQYMPTTLFVDSEGYLVGEMQVGSMPKANWKALIDTYLAQM